MSTCRIPRIDRGSRVRTGLCRKPAFILVEYGCVHEHIDTETVCEEHAAMISDLWCRLCLEAGHECPLLGRVREVTAVGGDD